MKRRDFFSSTLSAGLTGLAAGSCAKPPSLPERKKLFSFVHYSDCHIQPEQGAREGFLASIEMMNLLRPEFAISGGDMVMDALAVDETRAVMLYDMYIECCKHFNMPIYNVMGNHEVFGIYSPDKVPENHPEWGKEMFKKRLGEGRTYRSFDYKGVHFLLLDSVGIEKNIDQPGYHYIGELGFEQIEWLLHDIKNIPYNMPVIAVTHIPLFTWYEQIRYGTTYPSSRGLVLTDGLELFNILIDRSWFVILEGHIHVNEIYMYKGGTFVDTAAVCGAWWSGPRDGHPEGFNLVHVYEDGIETEYTTYGWDAARYIPQAFNTDVFPLRSAVKV